MIELAPLWGKIRREVIKDMYIPKAIREKFDVVFNEETLKIELKEKTSS